MTRSSDPLNHRTTAYTPWFRGDERKRELREVGELYAQVARLHAARSYSPSEFCQRVFRAIGTDLPPMRFFDTFSFALHSLIEGEQYIFALPPPTFEGMTANEFVAYRNFLQRKLRFYETEAETLGLVEKFLVNLFTYLSRQLPKEEDATPFMTPAIFAVPDARHLVQNILGAFSDPATRGLRIHRGTAS